MNFNAKPFKNWFGFSRRERRATFVLLILIVIIIALRYTIPESTIPVRDITGIVSPENDISGNTSSPQQVKTVYTAYHSYRSGDSLKKSRPNDNRRSLREGNIQRSERPGRQSTRTQKSLIDINICDSSDLVLLPGIGPVLSARIIKYRYYLGGFANIGQLREVYGLSPETYELIKSRILADSTVVRRIRINTADYKELSRVRYLEKFEITAILKYRELKGRINNINDLTNNKLIAVEKASKVGPYLIFD
jgi:DNA uptake protein ComE-like DNA-binding protein